MQAVKSKGTKLERRLFALLAQMGLRGWKQNVVTITGKPDVAFVSNRVAVFVDGCFWHGCPRCKRKLPVTNREYWERKIKRNVELAQRHSRELRKAGWEVIRVWEHEIADSVKIKTRILKALEGGMIHSEQNSA